MLRHLVLCLVGCAPAATQTLPAPVTPRVAETAPPDPVVVQPTWTSINVPCGKVAAVSAKSPAPKWSARASGTEEQLNAVHGHGGEVYVVGSAGVVLHSTDGGYSMERCTLKEDLHAVAAVGDGEVWVGGESNVYRRTSKGWFARTPATGKVSSISAASADDVWLIANRRELLHATNDAWTSDKHCVATEQVWARSNDDIFLECAFFVQRSVDGVTFLPSAFEPHVESGFRIHGVANDIWIAGTAGTLDASFDGGVTFTPVDTPVSITAFHGVAALGQGRAIVVGAGVHTRFAKTWVTEIPDTVGIGAIYAGSAMDVWVVGRAGTILHRP